jgi:hypothetical protein
MSKIGKAEWILLYIVTIIIDLIQYIIDLTIYPTGVGTGIGVAINMVLDPIIGALLVFYFKIRGISLTKRIGRLVSILGVTGLGTLTGGILSFWILDIWYIHRDVRKEEAEQKNNTGIRDK